MTTEIPKRIKLIVNKGQGLQLYHPSKTIKKQPRKWRVLFLGVVEKMATAKVESDNGNPEWLCEITVTSKNPNDPISMLVTDSKGRHIGQVIINLNNVPPKPVTDNERNGRPPLLLSNLLNSELEPTPKNAHPRGHLYYWMWIEDYWQVEEINKLKIKKSLSRSMQNLSNSTLNLFRHRKSIQESQITNGSGGKNSYGNHSEVGLKASPLKVNQLKNLNHKSSSDTCASTYNFSNPHNSGTMSNSPNSSGYHSTNPFDALAPTVNNSIENNMSHPEPYESNNSATLSYQTSICSKESPNSGKKRFGFFSRFRAKKSKSSVDLNKMATDSESKLRIYEPQSLGKHGGNRLFEKKNDISKSTTNLTTWYCGDTQLQENKMRNNTYDSKRADRPRSCMIQYNNDGNPFMDESNIGNQSEFHVGEHYNPNKPPINLNRNFSLNTPAGTSDGLSTCYNNNYDNMNKRELIEKVMSLDVKLSDLTAKHRSSENEAIQLRKERNALQMELSTVRDELCKLKCSLLEAGETKYLEKSRADEISEMKSWRAHSNF